MSWAGFSSLGNMARSCAQLRWALVRKPILGCVGFCFILGCSFALARVFPKFFSRFVQCVHGVVVQAPTDGETGHVVTQREKEVSMAAPLPCGGTQEIDPWVPVV